MKKKNEISGITVDKFYDFITSQMSAEQALKLLLASSVVNYEKLKFKEGEEVHPVLIIALASMDMGWQILVENMEGSDAVRGLAVGTEEYMNKYLPDSNKSIP